MHPLHGPEGGGSVVVVRPVPAPLELAERNLERPSLGEDHRPLYEVGQLPHVSRPGMPPKRLERLARDDLDVSIHRTGELLHEEPDKRRNVLGSLTQRGDVDGKDVQAIVEIVAEALFLEGIAPTKTRS